MKICKDCGTEKEITEFNKRSDKSDGLDNWCRDCSRAKQRLYHIKYRANNKQKINEYQQNNKLRLSEYQKKYREQNKAKIASYQKEYQKEYRKLN